MVYLLFGVFALVVLLVAAQSFANANPAVLARRFKVLCGVVLLGFGGFFTLTGRMMIGLPVAAFGLSLLGWGRLNPFSSRRTQKSGGQRSTVRSAMLEMELDHDSGEMRGFVLAGHFHGRELEDLSPVELKELWLETAADSQSRALIEAYFDRRFARWREDFEADGADGHGGSTGAGPMTYEEAYEVLGLAPNAGEAEIRAAHRRLMKRVHPDSGGSTFLAAKLNEAKDTLLRRH